MEDSDSEISDFEQEARDALQIDRERQRDAGKRKTKTKTKDEEALDKIRKLQKRKKRKPEEMTREQHMKVKQMNPLIDLLHVQVELVSDDGMSTDDDGGSKRKGKKARTTSSPKKPLKFKSELHSPGLPTKSTQSSPAKTVKMEVDEIKPAVDEETSDEDSGDELEKIATQRAKKESLSSSSGPIASSSKVKVEDRDTTDEDELDDLEIAFRKRERAARIKKEMSSTPPSSSDTPTASPPMSKMVDLEEDGELVRPSFPSRNSVANAYKVPLVLGHDENGSPVQVPDISNRYLREYQRDGMRFIYDRFARGEGGILGDDMGLGKTIQVIGFLSAIMGRTGHCEDDDKRRSECIRGNGSPKRPSDIGPTCLIICPSSVTHNWAREIDTWGWFSTCIFKGDKKERDVLRKRFQQGHLDIMIASIDGARTHIEDLVDLDLTCIVVDECHKLKNPASQTLQALSRFPTLRRYGLTGTAMQNRYGEFHTILNWAFPGKLGTAIDWKEYVTRPLSEAQKSDATVRQLGIGRERAINLVENLLPKFFLRRTKQLIADQLPSKIDKVVFCPMSNQQMSAYRRLLASQDVELLVTYDEPCECGTADAEGAPYPKYKCCHQDLLKMILPYMTLFQKIANHVCLIYPDKRDYHKEPKKYAKDNNWIQIAFPSDYADRQATYRAEQDKSLCGKWAVLRDLLVDFHKSGDKVLIFSRSKRLLNALEHWLTEEYPDGTLRLDGDTPADKRLDLCDDFNSKPEIFAFLISTVAGGVGLNLTGANKVVIFDPNWNPSHDLQAQDRSYRWGQTRDVTVYRLVAAGTLEELIYTRQIYKQQATDIAYKAAAQRRYFQGVEGDKTQKGELFGVKNIFRLRDESMLMKPIIEQCNMTELEYALRHMDADDDDDAVDEKDANLGVKDEEEALALIDGRSLPSKGSTSEVAEILRKNGITYTHDNPNVIGESAIEQKVSENAMKLHAAERSQRNARYNETTSAIDAPPRKKQKKAKVESTDGVSSVWPPPRGPKHAADRSAKAEPRALQPKRDALQTALEETVGSAGNAFTLDEYVEAAGYRSLESFSTHLFSFHPTGQRKILKDAFAKLKRNKQ